MFNEIDIPFEETVSESMVRDSWTWEKPVRFFPVLRDTFRVSSGSIEPARTDADLHGLPSFPARPHARRRDRGRRRVYDPLRLYGRRAVPIALHERPLSGAADRAVQGANGLLGRALRRRYGLGRPVRTGLRRSADRRLVGRQSRGYGRPGPDAGRRDGSRGSTTATTASGKTGSA